MNKILAALASVIFVACAGSAARQSAPNLYDLRAPEPPHTQAVTSLNQQEAEQKKLAENEARLKAEIEPKAVRVIREALSPNPTDARYGQPAAYVRFQRPWSPTLGSPATAP
jgi:hypothetical protein